MKTAKPKPAPPVPRERPIAFAGRWIPLILSGRKTQTRRPIDLRRVAHRVDWIGWTDGEQGVGWYAEMIEPAADIARSDEGAETIESTRIRCPHDAGDQLWLREAWRTWAKFDSSSGLELPGALLDDGWPKNYRPIRWEADGRISLDWLDERRGRLRPSRFMPRWASRIVLDVTEIVPQRLQSMWMLEAIAEGVGSIEEYRAAWDATYPAAPSSANPWVWATSFALVGSTNSRA